MSGIPSISEHSDLIQVITVALIGVVAWMIKRWDAAHTMALDSIIKETERISKQVSGLTREFYELKGEHNAHHGSQARRISDNKFDDMGFNDADDK